MADTKRISYLDMARGIGMVLVVMGHVAYINPNLRQFITAFHMPLFFLISGILLEEKREEEKGYIGVVHKKLQSIMIPYMVFSLAYFILESTRIILKGLDEWNVVLRQLFQSCCLQGVSTLWFLPALFISELLFIGIRKNTNHVGTILVITTIVLGCYVLNNYEQLFYQYHGVSRQYRLLHDVCSMIIRNLFCAGFVCVGYYINRWLLKNMKKRIQEVSGIFICIVMAYLIITSGELTDLRFMQLGVLPVYMLGAVAGSMAIILLCKLLQELPIARLKRVLEFYGRNSLIIMVTHIDFRVLYISILIAQQIQNIVPSENLFCTLIVLLVFIIEIPLIWFTNRYLPFVLGKMKKNS
ncbi:MAG: acyltransferase family protein [Lachnospiraceae bacterium]|nr:acyltransferase family protein [Lachnospiraceae bacterium]